MTHNRENLRLSLYDLQQTTTTPINTSSSSSQSMSVIANQAITTVANKLAKCGGVYQNEKCERLKKMTSITYSDSEDDSERRMLLDCGGGAGVTHKWSIKGYEGVSGENQP